MTRQQNEKKQILNQIQTSLRRKKHDYETFSGVISLQLPQINNVTSFPISRPNNKKKYSLIYSPKKINPEKERENILSLNNVDLTSITNKEGGKIIEPRHLKNWNPFFQRTGFATSLNLSLNQQIVKSSYHSHSMQKKQRRYKQQQFIVACKPIQLCRSTCDSEKEKLYNYLTVKQSPQIKKAKNCLIYDFLPQYRQTKVNKMARFKSDLKQLKKDNENLQKYSPWLINQEEQLII